MKATLVALGLVAVGVITSGLDVYACGDKSLSAGGIRFQRALAAQYPASVLIYVRPDSRTAAAVRELKLQESLRQFGHTYREVASPVDLDVALGSGRFNIVIADSADMADVQHRIEASSSRPTAIAIAYKLNKAEAAEAAKRYRFLVKAPSRTVQYLSTIAEAVRSQGSVPRKG